MEDRTWLWVVIAVSIVLAISGLILYIGTPAEVQKVANPVSEAVLVKVTYCIEAARAVESHTGATIHLSYPDSTKLADCLIQVGLIEQ